MTQTFAISAGDPLGVGPEVTIKALKTILASSPGRFVVFGDAKQLQSLATKQGLSFASCEPSTRASLKDNLVLCDVGQSDHALERKAHAQTGALQLAALDAATNYVLQGFAKALITAPVSKQAITLSLNKAFLGHTEYLAQKANLKKDAVTMLFIGPKLSVALVTTHLALANVPQAITSARVERAMHHLAEVCLRKNTSNKKPQLAVAGLNPHAGEDGLLGSEEAQTIAPLVQTLRAQYIDAVDWHGPVPAESAFRLAANARYDGVVAMYHDQATIASKLLDWEHAVNLTWGLPFVRTSVDHGVAYDIAGKNIASEQGMVSAILLAQKLTHE